MSDKDLELNENLENISLGGDTQVNVKDNLENSTSCTEILKEGEVEDKKGDSPNKSDIASRKNPYSDVTQSSNNQKEENPILIQLREAFPKVEERLLKAVIIASQGSLAPAFNALLYISDPSFENEASVPMKPIISHVKPELSQLQQDELLARKLDNQFNNNRSNRQRINKQGYNRQKVSNHHDTDDEDFFSQLIDKELPQLRENLNRNVQETSKKIGTWFNNVKKNFIEETDERDLYAQYNTPEKRRGRFNSFGAKYDEQEFSTNFSSKLENHGISLSNDDEIDDDDEIPPQLPSRGSGSDSVVVETACIDTPDTIQKVKWISSSSDQAIDTPSKSNSSRDINLKTPKKFKNPDDDEFLINSDDELQ